MEPVPMDPEQPQIRCYDRLSTLKVPKKSTKLAKFLKIIENQAFRSMYVDCGNLQRRQKSNFEKLRGWGRGLGGQREALGRFWSMEPVPMDPEQPQIRCYDRLSTLKVSNKSTKLTKFLKIVENPASGHL